MMRRRLGIALLAAVATSAAAQESASFDLREHALNAGGHPADGIVLASLGFRMSLGSIGDAVVRRGLASASFRADAGFVSAYPPPGEVLGLAFDTKTTLRWNSEPSAGTYNLYRDLLGNLSGLGYGLCAQPDLAGPTATDADPVAPGAGFFYLATVENRLDEEGTKGFRRDGTERGGTVCP